jgi:hypothetical protein
MKKSRERHKFFVFQAKKDSVMQLARESRLVQRAG